MRHPDFFIVGAPKCGTTAMYNYLAPHPQVFLPRAKEIHFYGQRDLTWHRPPVTPALYERHFEGAEAFPCVGEVAVWYLLSEAAAGEIHAAAPDARIVAMLREPVEMLYSLHSQLLFSGDEDIEDFAEALAAEPDRRAGRRLPDSAHTGLYSPPFEALQYRRVVAYAEQLGRYIDRFGRDRVHVVLFDDLRADAPGVYRHLLGFLGVDREFTPGFAVHNPNKVARSARIQRTLQKVRMSRAAQTVKHLPGVRPVGRAVAEALQNSNTRYEKRSALDPDLAAVLRRELAPGMDALEVLLGRDLSAWKEA